MAKKPNIFIKCRMTHRRCSNEFLCGAFAPRKYALCYCLAVMFGDPERKLRWREWKNLCITQR